MNDKDSKFLSAMYLASVNCTLKALWKCEKVNGWNEKNKDNLEHVSYYGLINDIVPHYIYIKAQEKLYPRESCKKAYEKIYSLNS